VEVALVTSKFHGTYSWHLNSRDINHKISLSQNFDFFWLEVFIIPFNQGAIASFRSPTPVETVENFPGDSLTFWVGWGQICGKPVENLGKTRRKLG
jgi:hypothetical protein